MTVRTIRLKRLALAASMLIAVGLFVLLVFCIGRGDLSHAAAEGGVYAVEDFGAKVSLLKGDWEFYWNELLGAGQFEGRTPVSAEIPGIWNDLAVDGKPLPGYGYGTYRLRLTGLTQGEKIGVYVPVLSVAYELYADGELVAKNGTVSKTKEGFVPAFLPQVGFFTAQGGEAELIVHSSNFIYARNGMWHPIYLGTPSQALQLHRMVIYKDLFMLGAYITLAVYFLALFALRRESQSLVFALLCMGATIRTMVNGDRAIARLIADFPFDWLIRCDYIALLLFYPVMLYLMARRFPDEFNKKVALGFVTAGSVSSLLVMVLPVSVFTRYVMVAEILLFSSILYTLMFLVVAALRSRRSAIAMLFAILLLLTLTLRDLMYQSGVMDNPVGEVAAFGFLLFLLIESFAIARDNAESFRNVKRLSQELIESDQLKDRIRQTEMAFWQSQIKPHFLFNSLSVIDEYCQIDPKEASRLIGSLSRYLRQSFDFENLENSVPIEKELTLVSSYVDIESARFDDLRVENQIEYCGDFCLPPLTIQPLVENAIRHGVRKKAGQGRVVIRIEKRDADIVVSVADDGAGIPPEKLGCLLDDASRGKSVGLRNIHNRLLRMYGRGLHIASEPGVGTTVSFSIPAGG